MAWRRRVLFTLVVLSWAMPAVAAATESSPKPKDDDYELYRTLVDTIDQVERNYVTKVKRRELVESAIRGVLSKLDPYSNYIAPDDLTRFRTTVESEFGGIGIQVANDDGQLQIISPMHGTPAYRAGLIAGDRIVEVDGKSTDGWSLDDAVEKLKGDAGTTVTLTVIHPGKEKREKYTIKRERIHIDTVLGDHRNPDGTWSYMLDDKQRIGYVRITAFSRDTASELERVLKQLKKEHVKSLIVDLRFNPGGLLNAAIEVCDLFVAEGRIVSTKGRSTPERTWDAHKDGVFEDVPLAVLVNHYSASASEIVSACLQDHKRAVVIGERTWGKGSVQNVIDLDEGRSALKLTTASYHRPSGKNIHRFPDAKDTDEWGVMPNKGYEIKLNNKDMLALVQMRREREIIQPPPGKGDTDAKVAVKAEMPKEDAKPGEKVAATVDTQLQAAVKYLSTEMAKAQ